MQWARDNSSCEMSALRTIHPVKCPCGKNKLATAYKDPWWIKILLAFHTTAKSMREIQHCSARLVLLALRWKSQPLKLKMVIVLHVPSCQRGWHATWNTKQPRWALLSRHPRLGSDQLIPAPLAIEAMFWNVNRLENPRWII